MKKALVIGYGVSGRAAEKLLEKLGFAVSIFDDQFSKELPGSMSEFELAVLSPGVPQTNPVLDLIREANIRIVGEAQFALEQIVDAGCRCIALTGTNGKTTTTMMITHILEKVGKAARALGNIGFALSEYALDPNKDEICVVELSSFQLETLHGDFFEAAAILNLSPDHLDRYENLDAYAKAKLRISECIKPGGSLYIGMSVADGFKKLLPSEFVLLSKSSVISPMMSAKTAENVTCACALLNTFDLPEQESLDHLKSFKKWAHRLEHVCRKNGVNFVNDSKATNVDSVLFALDSIKTPILLLLGGRDKGDDFSRLASAVKGKVSHLILFGEAADLIERALTNAAKMSKVSTLQEAVALASRLSLSGETILLSPGCSSYDMFQNYKERGKRFKEIAFQL